MLATILFFLNHTAALSQVVEGYVFDQDSIPLANASVEILGTRLSGATDSSGHFAFARASEGTYTIEAWRIGYGRSSRTITVAAGSTLVFFQLQVSPLPLRVVTVTARPQPTDLSGTSESVSVVEGEDLARGYGSTPESGLRDVPGVSTVNSGPFSEKPVIRGLGFQRVVVLEDGQRSESQQWDDDDSPAVDALSTRRIEVVRGPSSVLYGSDALGGVINFIQGPMAAGRKDSLGIAGTLMLNGFSNNRQGAVRAELRGTDSLDEFSAGLTLRRSGDERTPVGSLANTAGTETNFRGDIFATRPWGGLTLSYAQFDQHRDILPLPDDWPNLPYQWTRHNMGTVKYRSPMSPVRVEVTGAVQQNDAAEYDDPSDPEPSNENIITTYSAEAKILCNAIESHSATAGISAVGQRNSASGTQPLIPDYRQSTMAVYLFDDYRMQEFDFSLGGRYDVRNLSTSEDIVLGISGQARRYDALTGAAGVLWHASTGLTCALNAAKGWRSPIVEELFTHGLEEGSLRYKLGDPNLISENSYSTDAIVRFDWSGFRGEIDGYRNRVNRYIYLAPTGLVDSASGAMKYSESQANATLIGADCDLEWNALRWAKVKLGGNYLRAENDGTGDPLPLTPANRLNVAAEFSATRFFLLTRAYGIIQTDLVFDQNRVGPDELRTGGYTVLNAGFGGTLNVLSRGVKIYCRVDNLFNRLYRDHLNLYKLYAPDAGIDCSMSASIPLSIENETKNTR